MTRANQRGAGTEEQGDGGVYEQVGARGSRHQREWNRWGGPGAGRDRRSESGRRGGPGPRRPHASAGRSGQLDEPRLTRSACRGSSGPGTRWTGGAKEEREQGRRPRGAWAGIRTFIWRRTTAHTTWLSPSTKLCTEGGGGSEQAPRDVWQCDRVTSVMYIASLWSPFSKEMLQANLSPISTRHLRYIFPLHRHIQRAKTM